MTESRLQELEDLKRFYETRLLPGPFPLADVSKIGGLDEFHAYLTIYLADIAGIASHGRKLDRISDTRLQDFKEFVSKSFFERYPALKSFESQITASNTPLLFKNMADTETARLKIRLLLERLP